MLQEELKVIRVQLRLAMNGVISTSMREKGIVYRLNFGVPLPELRQIAAKHTPNAELAAALWKEDIREFKILASFLQPVEQLTLVQANQWVKEIPYLEIAEQCSHNLFYRILNVDVFLKELLTNSTDEYARTVAFLVLTELFKREQCVSVLLVEQFLAESMRTLVAMDQTVSYKEKQSAVKALKFYGRISSERANSVLACFDVYPEYKKSQEGKEIYQDLKFEFDFFS